MTQENVALNSGLTREFISQVERDVSSPSVDNFLKICRAIGVSPTTIMGRVERAMGRR